MSDSASIIRLFVSWPLSALLTWVGAWILFVTLQAGGLSAGLALVSAGVAGGLCGWCETRWWRRVIMLSGFPLAIALSGLIAVPAWSWLLLLLVLLLVYPLKSWRDAPLFPTPVNALNGLAGRAFLPADALILDAGCGLGDGLIALHRAYPQARLHGLELSWPLRFLSAMRCPWARVRQGDIWSADWSAYAMVYLFQRPESMAHAAAKATAQLKPGAWLVSLEFEATTLVPQAVLTLAGTRSVWLYQVPFQMGAIAEKI